MPEEIDVRIFKKMILSSALHRWNDTYTLLTVKAFPSVFHTFILPGNWTDCHPKGGKSRMNGQGWEGHFHMQPMQIND